MSNFAELLKETTDRVQDNVSITENGAIGYKTSGKKLVDLNYALGSMRNMSESEIWDKFMDAYNENPTLSLLWLFFSRDIRGGSGERRVFRVIFKRFCRENSSVAIKLLPLIPFYGRWDDLLDVYCGDVPCDVKDKTLTIIREQLEADCKGAVEGKPISLLAKWAYSNVTSSKETRRKAEILRSALGYTPRDYRQTLSRLRRHLNVVEQKMSANDWAKIEYSTVASKAMMNYRGAFMKHDEDRFLAYLQDVKSGAAKIHSGTLYPYDIVHAYRRQKYDDTLEAQWNALPDTVSDDKSTLVVVDGSGSMGVPVGNTTVTAHDVADSLGLYFAERLNGLFHNMIMTFGRDPRLIKFNEGLSLHERIGLLERETDCSNTNIEKVFNVILTTAVTNHLPQSELPQNILIVSDGEFDWMVNGARDVALFKAIEMKYKECGYKLPRLVFWNVCSRTGTIPLCENEMGVALVSGFSPNIADMVMSGELDPYVCLVNKLNSERYAPVLTALREE